jgi:hypothetical protein
VAVLALLVNGLLGIGVWAVTPKPLRTVRRRRPAAVEAAA